MVIKIKSIVHRSENRELGQYSEVDETETVHVLPIP